MVKSTEGQPRAENCLPRFRNYWKLHGLSELSYLIFGEGSWSYPQPNA